MRPRILLLSLTAAALVPLAFPAPADAAPPGQVLLAAAYDEFDEWGELPQPNSRRPKRNTTRIDADPYADDTLPEAQSGLRFADDESERSGGSGGTRSGLRFHDDEDGGLPQRSAPPPARARTRPAVEQDDTWEPAPRRRRAELEDADELRRSADHDEPRRRGPRRSTRTAEEELGDGRPELRERLSGLDEPGIGLAAEVQTGVMWLDYATGGSKARFAAGLNFSWQFGRLFAPENKLLHEGLFLEGSYLYTSLTEGTDAVQVGTGYHYLSAAVLAGYPFSQLLLYGKFGPAMVIMPVSYDVQGNLTEFTGVKGGMVYGVGMRTSIYLDDRLGISCRLELQRFRRHYLDDTLLSFGAGMSF